MKSINLYSTQQGWQSFNYENITDLKTQLEAHGISIGYGAIIGDGAIIGENLKIKCIAINGSRHHVSYCGQDSIQIGCKQFTISQWEEMYSEVGEEEGYDDSEKEEYLGYISIIKAAHESGKFEPIKINN